MKTVSRVFLYSALSLMALLWGLVFVAIKIGGDQMPIQVFNANRFVIGAVLLMLVTVKQGRWQSVDRRTAIELTGLGLLGHGLMQIVMVSGIMRTTASISALIYGCTPLIVAGLSAALGLEQLKKQQWTGLFMAAIGMAVVVLLRPPGMDQAATYIGNALMMAAALTMAIYTVWSRRLLARLDLMFVTTWVLNVGAVVMVIWSLPYQRLALYRQMTWVGWAAILYGALLALVIPNLLFLFGVREIGRARTAAFVNAVPPLGCLAGWLILGEALRPLQVIGAVLIVGGIMLVQMKKRRRVSSSIP